MAEEGDGQDICTFFASFIDQRQQVERLLNWLRESQTTCTDTNCFDSVSGFPGTEQGGALLPNTETDYDCQEPLDQNPLALVILFVFGMLSLYAITLNRNQQPMELQPTKNKAQSSPNSDDHDRSRSNDDDDQSRPAL